jgi:hypothetical protein
MRRRFNRSAPPAHARQAAIDARIDTKTGEFDMVLATEGEAADGHIISIKGLEVPSELPLQVDHSRSVLSNIGLVRNARRDTIGGVPVMRGTGQIRLTGDGEAAAARRDLVDAISAGDVRGVSLSWDALKTVDRRDLPREHPAYVKAGEPDLRKRWGIYFEKSRAIEQSIVGIPADREALIGREQGAENALSRQLWHSLVERLDAAPRSREAAIIEALEGQVADLEERLAGEAAAREAASDPIPVDPLADLEARLEALARQIADARQPTTDLDDALADMFLRVTGKNYNG